MIDPGEELKLQIKADSSYGRRVERNAYVKDAYAISTIVFVSKFWHVKHMRRLRRVIDRKSVLFQAKRGMVPINSSRRI